MIIWEDILGTDNNRFRVNENNIKWNNRNQVKQSTPNLRYIDITKTSNVARNPQTKVATMDQHFCIFL